MNRSGVDRWKPLLCVVAAGVVLRFYALSEPQLWLDELIQLLSFSHPTWGENFRSLAQQPAVAPLDYVVQRFFVWIWGATEVGGRFHSALFGSLSLPLFYLVVDRLLDHHRALIATFILAVYPLHVFYSREGRNYSLFVFLTLLTFYLLLRSLSSKQRMDWVYFAAVWTLLLYTNYLAGLILAVQILLVLGWCFFPSARRGLDFRVDGSDLIRFGGAALCAAALFLPWFLNTIDQAQASFTEDFFRPRFVLRVWREFSGGSSPLSLTLMILIGLGVRRLVSERRFGVLSLLGLWFLVPFFGVLFLDWWRSYFFAIRQVLVTAPAVLVLAAVGVNGRETWRGFPALTLLLVAALGVGTLVLSDRKNEADWKGLVRLLEEREATLDGIVAPGIEPVLGFLYPEFNRRKLGLEALQDRLVRRTEEGARTDSRGDEIVLIDYRPLMSDQRAVLKSLLEIGESVRSDSLRGFDIHFIRIGS